MSKTNLGKVLITPRGIWSGDMAYKRLDVVYAQNGSYLAKQDNHGIPVTDTEVWQPVAGRGPAGTGNVSAIENGLEAGKKYFFVPSTDNCTEGLFEEYIPSEIAHKQADWNQMQTDQPDYIKNKPELFSGDYNDLKNIPDLFSGNYEDLQGKPFIPTKTSDLENDSSFITNMEVQEGYQTKQTGKGLSSNDYTTEEKDKLAEVEIGAQRNRPIIHKSVMLEPSNWELFEELWLVTIKDADIVDGVLVDFWPSNETEDTYIAAGIKCDGIGVVGSFTLTARYEPSSMDSINLKYTISI